MLGRIITLPFWIVKSVVGIVFGLVKFVLGAGFGIFRFILNHVFGTILGGLIGFFLGRNHIGIKLFPGKKKRSKPAND